MASSEEPKTSESQAYPSFEEAFSRLGETVQALESGGLTIEAATNLYEEGMRLIQLCNRFLSKAELKITQLRDVYSDYQVAGPPEEDLP